MPFDNNVWGHLSMYGCVRKLVHVCHCCVETPDRLRMSYESQESTLLASRLKNVVVFNFTFITSFYFSASNSSTNTSFSRQYPTNIWTTPILTAFRGRTYILIPLAISWKLCLTLLSLLTFLKQQRRLLFTHSLNLSISMQHLQQTRKDILPVLKYTINPSMFRNAHSLLISDKSIRLLVMACIV